MFDLSNFTIKRIFLDKYLVAAGARRAHNVVILSRTLNFSWLVKLREKKA